MTRTLFFLAALILTSGIAVNDSNKRLKENKKGSASVIPDAVTENHPVKVFILAGQSNAVGYNNISELHSGLEDVKKRLAEQPQIMFWPGSNARPGFANTWTKLQPRVSDISVNEPYKDGAFGPEIGFALSLGKALKNQKIAIIKYSSGGTGIARSKDYQDYIPSLKNFDDKGQNWYPQVKSKSGGLLYMNLMENIHEALSVLKNQGLCYEISGFIWMQGEHEAGISKKMASDYGKLLTLFRESVRHDLKIKDLPFMIGEINSHTWAFADIARKCQLEACEKDPNCLLVKTTDLPRGSIGGAAHFTADGMMTLGERFAEAMLTLTGQGNDEYNSGEINFGFLLQELTNQGKYCQMAFSGISFTAGQ